MGGIFLRNNLKIGEGPVQRFFQRYANGQKVHEKVLNINITHQGNANLNHHLTAVRVAVIKTTKDKYW